MSETYPAGKNQRWPRSAQASDKTLDEWAQVLAVVNTVDAVVWEADAVFAGFTFVSEQAERLLAYPVEQWLQEPNFWADHIHPDDRDWCVTFCDTKTRQSENHEFEYRMIAADGRVVWLRDIVTVVVEQGSPVMLRGIMIDITERKEASERLRHQEDQYRRIFEATTDGLVITDLESGKVLAANPAFCRMHGFADMVGMMPEDFIAPSGLGVFRERDQAVREGKEFRGRAQHVRKSGSLLTVEVIGSAFDFNGRPAVLGVVRDVSDQVKNELAMDNLVRERTQELESLLGIARAVTSTLDFDELVRLVLLELQQVVDYSAASLILLEGQDLVVHDVVFRNEEPDTLEPKKVRIPLTAWPTQADQLDAVILDYPCVQVAQSRDFWDMLLDGHSILIDDVLTNEGQIASDYRNAVGDSIHSPQLAFMRCWAAVPLQAKGRTIGYFGIASQTPNSLDEKRIRLARAFADHVALAIDNARLYEQAGERAREIERRRAVAEGLRELIAVVNSGRDIDQILEAVVHQAKSLLESDASQVFLPLPGSDSVLTVHASIGMPGGAFAPGLSLEGSAVGLAFKQGRPVAVPDVASAYDHQIPEELNPAVPLAEECDGFLKVQYLPMPASPSAAERSRAFSRLYHGFLAVPLISADQAYGVLTLSYHQARDFTSDDVALAMAFADQATLGVENARVSDQSQRLAAVEERQRLAQDLHDSVAQVLYGIALGAGTAKRHLASNPASVAAPIDYISSLAAAGLAEMRALIFDLQPDSLSKDGLVKAIERQVEALEARHGLAVETRMCVEPSVSIEAKEAVYRVIREAVHNVVKHAEATTVRIELEASDDTLVFEVADDGMGFDTSAEFPGHLGLHSMRNRIQSFGGILELSSSEGRGTSVKGSIPMP